MTPEEFEKYKDLPKAVPPKRKKQSQVDRMLQERAEKHPDLFDEAGNPRPEKQGELFSQGFVPNTEGAMEEVRKNERRLAEIAQRKKREELELAAKQQELASAQTSTDQPATDQPLVGQPPAAQTDDLPAGDVNSDNLDEVFGRKRLTRPAPHHWSALDTKNIDVQVPRISGHVAKDLALMDPKMPPGMFMDKVLGMGIKAHIQKHGLENTIDKLQKALSSYGEEDGNMTTLTKEDWGNWLTQHGWTREWVLDVINKYQEEQSLGKIQGLTQFPSLQAAESLCQKELAAAELHGPARPSETSQPDDHADAAPEPPDEDPDTSPSDETEQPLSQPSAQSAARPPSQPADPVPPTQPQTQPQFESKPESKPQPSAQIVHLPAGAVPHTMTGISILDIGKELKKYLPLEAYRPVAPGRQGAGNASINPDYIRDRFNEVFGVGMWRITPHELQGRVEYEWEKRETQVYKDRQPLFKEDGTAVTKETKWHTCTLQAHTFYYFVQMADGTFQWMEGMTTSDMHSNTDQRNAYMGALTSIMGQIFKIMGGKDLIQGKKYIDVKNAILAQQKAAQPAGKQQGNQQQRRMA